MKTPDFNTFSQSELQKLWIEKDYYERYSERMTKAFNTLYEWIKDQGVNPEDLLKEI